MARQIAQYITYQHNVQQYFRDHSEKYSGVIIPLSIATSFPTGTYGFVRALCSRHNGKKYAIDPRTPLFQRSWDRQNVRPPHMKMAMVLGEPFISKGLAGRLRPSDFPPEVVNAVTDNCLAFQMQFKARSEDVRKLQKYKRLLGLSTLSELGDPQFLIPPYFLFEQYGDSWHQVNTACLKASVSKKLSVPLCPVIHFPRWLDPTDWSRIVRDTAELGLSGLWMYPDDFREHEALVSCLIAYRKAVSQTNQAGLAGYTLFGGYYAILMHYFGLRGYSNGIGYGDWRDSGYHRGGTAVHRIYVPKLHRYLDPPTAQHIIEEDPEYFAADSELLSECVGVGRNLAELSLAECLDHFMECRLAEMMFVNTNPLASAVAELKETVQHLEAIGPLEVQQYGSSLGRWAEVLGADL